MSAAAGVGGSAPVAAGGDPPEVFEARGKRDRVAAVGQGAFRAGLLDAAQPVPAGLSDGRGRPAGRRYAVYRNNVAVSLREALETGFPAVAKLLGPENFAHLAGKHLRAEPPTSPLMMQYGAGFPAFLDGEAPARLGYLGDVARLELALRRSYHAADAKALDPARLQGLEDATLMATVFDLAPSACVLSSRWPVLSIWRYTLHADQPKPAARAEDVLIARPGFDPEPHLLGPGAAAFLRALKGSVPFGDALAAAGEGFDLSPTLGLLLRTGALSAMTTPAAPSEGERR